jgi:hypothetical protein
VTAVAYPGFPSNCYSNPNINADDKLQALFGGKTQATMFERERVSNRIYP